ncbi:polymer-forming cytoskeletal protein [Neptuniibacter sp. CAU 1671]|uniref:bactofilin family protein n=1 Tax=Neptuniibacter sp. CAU 1671 TaxID=3032593 RepID=UPI0023D9F15F|nr:polymer-forming cytoskeletal protein [Neptuniibacter sp. CAU 1671]MDF2181981.1 polymer-forming cytoskeletal protein [Neptuniibacter sp. CAU 1671]
MSIIGKMHIDGIFEGNISSLDGITIGKAGHVKGLIKARTIDVCGLLEGEVICDEMHIEPGGQVHATVESVEMSISPRGSFVGERRIKDKTKSLSESASASNQNAGKSGVEAIDSLPDKVVLKQKA